MVFQMLHLQTSILSFFHLQLQGCFCLKNTTFLDSVKLVFLPVYLNAFFLMAPPQKKKIYDPILLFP